MPVLNILSRKIEYVRYAAVSSDAPTLVFLHDGLGCVALWRDFPSQIAQATQCPTFVYSRFGYGQSDPVELPRPVQFMHDEALKVLPVIMEAAKIHNSILIGHSDGASIALIYAASAFGKNVCGLVLEAPHVFVEDITVQSISAAGEDYRNGNLKQRLLRHHGQNVDNAFWRWNRIWLDPDFRSWNIEEYLPLIKRPVLVIQGEDDNFGTTRQVQAISSQCAGPVKTVMMPDCGHTPHRDQPQLTFDSIVKFVQDLA